ITRLAMLILQDIRLSQLNRLNRRGIACVAGAFELSREICVRKYSGRSNGIAFDSSRQAYRADCMARCVNRITEITGA
ncbi:MAG: hypothetical protein WBD48_01770, partial [Pseudolabrys sp.]